MRLSINGRVVKSWDVEVSTPRMVENHEGFQQLGSCLAVLTVGEEIESTEKPDLPNWRESSEMNEQVNQILEDAKEKAAQIISNAEAEAQKMLTQAEAHVQELLDQAQAGLEHLQQEVRESTRAEIYPIAQEEGYQEGIKAGEAEGKRLTENANQLLKLAQRAVQEEYAKVDRELLHLAVKIAERIVRSTLAVEPQRLVGIIQSLTLLPLEREGWRLHVSPDDARWLEGNLPCPWVVDESLNSGDCFLECQEGIFDGRLEAQLEKLEHSLREEIEHGGVESVS
ncbi:flagellar assembly protein FliH [Desulfosporosinus sp. HMP52]|uniref:FliH/SctL family protein n=1 Tax=Desulfosporosinus sp. HMP52 TaxID=1487923 RepID=UPI00051FBF8E|nr:FliH/SctL family protein [Desulfosporosinus sp. HMP52]KGK90355.1 flagellar assembly protein FliH [Desulfosporosinus sp. HMP52]